MINENEHDITKRMLETIRNAKSALITENEDAGAGFTSNTTQVPTEGGAIESDYSEEEVDSSLDTEEEEINSEDNGLNTPEGKEEAEKIKKMVSPLINVKTFKIYEDSGEVVMSGGFQNTKIEWQFKKNDGLFIDANNVNLTENIKDMLDKLSAYYQNWQDAWAEKIEEYTNND